MRLVQFPLQKSARLFSTQQLKALTSGLSPFHPPSGFNVIESLAPEFAYAPISQDFIPEKSRKNVEDASIGVCAV